MYIKLLTLIIFWMFGIQVGMADQELSAVRVDSPPTIDGRANDPAWIRAQEITTHDRKAGIDIHLRAVYTHDKVFFLVRFPDPTENRQHKTLVWDEKQARYRTGPRREDTFVFKWSMEFLPVDMALADGTPHMADIWYWKACRTDHAGFADDKQHIYSELTLPKSQTVISDNGRTYYLRRRGDAGKPAYRVLVHKQFQGDETSSILPQSPLGSRADVLAKGQWKDGYWTLEFARRLDTGHSDDLVFEPGGSYLFGVSRYEIAGRQSDPTIEIPDYGVGDVGEPLTLRFRP